MVFTSYQSVEKAVHGFFNRRLAKTSFGQPLEMTAVFHRGNFGAASMQLLSARFSTD